MHKLFSIDINGSLVRIALSPGLSKYYLAYTANILKGEVTVYDLTTCTKQLTINAHKKPIIQMKFNSKSNFLATASSEVKPLCASRAKPSESSQYPVERGFILYAEECT
eukprot:TRINITY_DN9597_c0_g1_i9.p2 TRINITY_DN9597_c0_g1~~TRINITY_DN9597_c0_g1_i9.p2  ORF type:complete len:109 (+),score=31.93 TRINITY_DN9597_c0_g1_i9:541-867(+)